ncbi:peroxide stress protein YaaA [Massilibacteroides sp.]|uniref:peroxide stress protein YaaA n=1 Tax=Massilibacteroides sp. TaxID=2034766 RepID=UPI00260D655D|nr:peroxide stress protein YaaA [Massilibacteroides sp.]MDD4514088.1 peroxide stress protein YaaA [Massilibacteroides sp.]
MLILLSPAKTMSGTSKTNAPAITVPFFQNEANEIAVNMAQFSIKELETKLKLSPKLALESFQRFQEFYSPDTPSLQAILAYTGVVFKHINPQDFQTEDFLFAQDHLRFVSICYGVLRPFDGIKPYRMEYDIRLPELGTGNMYAYWRERQTTHLIEEVKKTGGILFNLASMDVQPAFDWKKVEESVRVITPDFKVVKNGKAKTVVIYAKMARGQMTRHIIKNKIIDPEQLKGFSWEGYHYMDEESDENHWTFLQ